MTLHEAAEHLRRSATYLHKPSGTRYVVHYSIAGLNELHPVYGSCKYASDEQLRNAEIWSRA